MKSGGFHLKSGGFHLKSGGFHVKSTQNLINSDVSAKTLQFGWISSEIERPLARNCNPMFIVIVVALCIVA